MGVDTWSDVPTGTEGGGWKPEEGAATNGETWAPDGNAGGDGFSGGFAPENISKHANDSGCRICGDDTHFARDCDKKEEGFGGGGNSGECYNCGEVGHNKADCPNPKVEREFTGTCRTCEQVGHRAADCPNKPPAKCSICKGEGHASAECNENRLVFAVQSLSMEDAWLAVEQADKEKDVDDIKKAILTYAKAYPQLTFEELEEVFRDSKMNTHLIAKEQAVSDTHTIINLQGRPDMKYSVSIQFSDKPRRAAFADGWPKSKEENTTRLTEAGFIVDRMVPKCSNCNQLGHGSRECTEEKQERGDKVVISCANCNEEGHRSRDCKQPRKSERGPRTCKNCGSEEHIAKECPEPPNSENVECRNCGETGHFSRDCPTREPDHCHNCGEEGHRAKDCEKERVVKCRNCDEIGHMSKECTKKKDWSRVKCSNCEEFGHGKARCPQPLKEVEDDGFGADSGAAAGGGDWGNSGPVEASGGW